MITQDELKKVLDYDPNTGIFRWKIKNTRTYIGMVAGFKNDNGYISIGVKRKWRGAHRLAWLYVHGYMPESDIDHINRDRTDNRISNLREASRSCNVRNSDVSITNKSGIKGVFWNKRLESWQVYIGIHGEIHYLGVHKDKIEAVCHRYAAEQCLGFEACDKNSIAKKLINELSPCQLST